MNKLFYENILNEKIKIPSNLLSQNIDYILLELLKKKIGNKCIKEGYVNKESISIIKRSIGEIDTNNLNSDIIFNILYKADICIPFQNNIIDCIVKDNNKLGIIAENNPLEIILAKQHHSDRTFYNEINKNDKILIKIIDKNFNLFDDKIIIIGKYIKKI